MTSEEDWRPVDVESLEDLAEDVVRSDENTLVIAGPGAGKTELLAQRANFLLVTGRCPRPKRILAISFKRDAAKNLNNRVRKRSEDHSGRFDSLTLDAFAKQLIDRFYLALPAEWRPRPNYSVRLTPDEDATRGWLSSGFVPIGFQRPNFEGMKKGEVIAALDWFEHGAKLPYGESNQWQHEWGLRRWREMLALPNESPSLSFPMLNRLAAFLLRENPTITAMLRKTYSHVFLDEFQDTTPSQWDLITAAFESSNSQMTAVGDSKQRIMVFAGADPAIFNKFSSTFGVAEPVRLTRNYRSVARLVQIQHAIAQIIETGTAEPVTATDNEAEGLCSILRFPDPESEAEAVANIVSELLSDDHEPRDICILARGNVGQMISPLCNLLRDKGISLRDESLLQDLRAEPVTTIVVHAINLATKTRDPMAWSGLTSELSAITGLDESSVALERLAVRHKDEVAAYLHSGEDIRQLPSMVVNIIGQEAYRSCYRQYMNGNFLNRVMEGLGLSLAESLANAGGIESVVADFTGECIVPAMSIHKSKGLEFKTVIFMGLEDGQWWNFKDQPEEEKRAFFVAFSRAIETVLFTYSNVRDTKYGRRRTSQNQIQSLLDILKQAGVAEV